MEKGSASTRNKRYSVINNIRSQHEKTNKQALMVNVEAENALSEIREVLASIKLKKNNYEDLISDIAKRQLEENPDIFESGNIRLICAKVIN